MSNQSSPWTSLNQALHHFQSSPHNGSNNPAAVNLYAAAAAAIAYNQLLSAANPMPGEKSGQGPMVAEPQRLAKGPAPHSASAFSIYTRPDKRHSPRSNFPKDDIHTLADDKRDSDDRCELLHRDRSAKVQSSLTQSLSSQQYQSNGETPKTDKRDHSSSQPEATKAAVGCQGSGSNTSSNQSTTVSGQPSPSAKAPARQIDDNKCLGGLALNGSKPKHAVNNPAAERALLSDKSGDQNENLSGNESNDELPDRKRQAERCTLAKVVEWKDTDDLSGSSLVDDDVHRVSKKPRLVWTPELHARFMQAVQHLGVNHAVPKTILKLMNVEGMTRENVASHLQKYRLYLKRLAGVSACAPIPPDQLNSVQEQAMKQHQAKQAQHAAQQAQQAAAQQAAAQSLLNSYGPPPPMNLVGMPLAYELRGYNFMAPGVNSPSVAVPPVLPAPAPMQTRPYASVQAGFAAPNGAQFPMYASNAGASIGYGMQPISAGYPGWGAGYPVMYNNLAPNSYGQQFAVAQSYAAQQVQQMYYGVPPTVPGAVWPGAN